MLSVLPTGVDWTEASFDPGRSGVGRLMRGLEGE
jgi:hypothetical protein